MSNCAFCGKSLASKDSAYCSQACELEAFQLKRREKWDNDGQGHKNNKYPYLNKTDPNHWLCNCGKRYYRNKSAK